MAPPPAAVPRAKSRAPSRRRRSCRAPSARREARAALLLPLKSLGTRGSTYIGFTVNPHAACGSTMARSSAARGTRASTGPGRWSPSCTASVARFPALQFEWAWQHPTVRRTQRAGGRAGEGRGPC